MERQNRGELLSCLRQACSHAETNLMQLIDSLQEPELTSLCQQYYDRLFEDGCAVHSCIPETELLSFELDLSRIDAMIIKRLVQSLNGFAMLVILLQLYNQLNEPMREDGIFGRIIGNFAALADHVVDKQMVLIFLLILYRYAQTGACYNSLVFGDSVYFGVGVLLQFFGMKRSFDQLNLFWMLKKQFISFEAWYSVP